mgnify:CR=1 FL=1
MTNNDLLSMVTANIESIGSIEGRVCVHTRLDKSTSRQLDHVSNIGMGIENSVTALVVTFLDVTEGHPLAVHEPARAGEQSRGRVHPRRVPEVLRCESTISLVDGLRAALSWSAARKTDPVGVARF